MRLHRSLFPLLCLYAFQPLVAQQSISSTFQQKLAQAFSVNGSMPATVSLSGSAKSIAGSRSEQGNFQVQVSSDGSTSESWSGSPAYSYSQGPLEVDRTCSRTDQSQNQTPVFGPNCVQGIPWFFPSYALQAAYSAATHATDVSTSADTSQGLVRVSYTFIARQLSASAQDTPDTLEGLQKATAATVLYSAETGLPAELVYHQALDSDESSSIEVSVKFSDYSNEAGFMIPHHIQRYIQRTLQFDLTVTSATIR